MRKHEVKMSNFNFGKVENNPQTSAAEIAPAIEMGISNAPTRLIVKYITDMYSYPLEAAIRETISNAIDAATAAGHGLEGVHAEVNGEYGSYEDGEFCVRDNGAGMSNEKLINVYTQYGVSDKRDDEDATGAFGLGAKSPLAYINEFHIITKTVDEGCRYVHCYRTPADDFLADPPVKVDGTIQIKDNLAALRGHDKMIEITDPFAADETGTLIKFPVWHRELRKARGVLESIDRLFYNCGEGSICGMEYSYDPRFFEVANFDIADDKGDKIEARLFVADTATAEHDVANYSRRDVAGLLTSLFDSGRYAFGADHVAFKVGDWLYPANGSAWTYSDYAATCDYPYSMRVIMEVPSKALPFIPSRDTLRADATNGNAATLVEIAKEKLIEVMTDKARFTELLNWHGEMFCSCADALPYALNVNAHTFSVENDTLKATCVRTTAPYTVNVDMTALNGVAGFKASELAAMPPVVLGYVEVDANGTPKMKNGPWIAPANRAAQFIGYNARISGQSGSSAGFGLAKSKKCADNLVACGFTATDEVFEYAAKDPAKRAARNGEAITIDYPAGLGIIGAKHSIFGNSKGAFGDTLVIVDGSQYGMSKIRSGINRIFVNKKAVDGFAHCMFAIIPPKTATSNWTADEIAAQVADLTRIGEATFKKVVYVSHEDLPGALAKIEENGITRAERTELDRMFNLNRTLTLKDRTANSEWAAFSGHRGAKCKNLGELICSNKSSWGVIIAGNYDQPYNVAYEYAKAAFALDLVPAAVTSIACIGANHYNAARAELLDREGITVIYDESGITPFEPVIANGDMRYEAGHVVYTGHVPENIMAYKEGMNAAALDTSVRGMWRTKLGGGYSWRTNYDSLDVSMMVEAFTFGHEHYASASDVPRLVGWVEEAVRSISIDTNNAATNLANLEHALSDILAIWKAHFSRVALQIDVNTMTNSSIRDLVEVARLLGVEEDVEAYYTGVPVADIIA